MPSVTRDEPLALDARLAGPHGEAERQRLLDRMQAIEARLRALAARGESPASYARLRAALTAVSWALDIVRSVPAGEASSPNALR